MTKRRIISILVVVFIALTIPVTVRFVQEKQNYIELARAGPAVLQIIPPAQTLKVGEEGVFLVSLNPNGTKVKRMELVIGYDSETIEVTNVRLSDEFTDQNFLDPKGIFAKNFSRDGEVYYIIEFSDEIDFSISTISEVISVNFRARSPGKTIISFIDRNDRPRSAVFDERGFNVLEKGIVGKIIIFN